MFSTVVRQARGITRLVWTPLVRLGRNERGSISAFVAAGAIVLAAVLGLATDAARGYLVKAKLSQALDAAALAGAKAMFSPTRDDEIRMYFKANFPPGYLGATVSGPDIIVNDSNEVISLSASASLDTTITRVLGIENMSVGSATEVTRKTNYTDIVLAIDISGSMGGSAGGGMTRIEAVRSAATNLVNILFGNNETKDLLKIGLVPWSAKVNVMLDGVAFNGALTSSVIVPAYKNPLTGAINTKIWFANNSPVPLFTAPPANWKGCVYSRYKNNGTTVDDADIYEGFHSSTYGEWVAWEPVGIEGEPVAGSARCALAVGGQECIKCPKHGITPLQNTKSKILTRINALTTPDGSTNITQGLGWAWRVLTPSAPFNEADPNPPAPRVQAIVLLSDGENFAGSGDGYKAIWGLGAAGQPNMDERLRLLAANIKAAGVVIYVIQFANSGGAIEALLKEVASSSTAPYYNYAPDAAALHLVFNEVANHLSELRISK